MKESIIGKAQENNAIEINAINIRDFSKINTKGRRLSLWWWGGMVMTPQPIYDAYLSIIKDLSYKPKLIYLSPQERF